MWPRLAWYSTCSWRWPWTPGVLLLLLPKCWKHGFTPPQSVYVVLGVKSGLPLMLVRHSAAEGHPQFLKCVYIIFPLCSSWTVLCIERWENLDENADILPSEGWLLFEQYSSDNQSLADLSSKRLGILSHVLAMRFSLAVLHISDRIRAIYYCGWHSLLHMLAGDVGFLIFVRILVLKQNTKPRASN